LEFPYGSPYNADGEKQQKLHTKSHLFIKDDLHHQIENRPGNPEGGLQCQDCHNSIDVLGDGNIFGTTPAQVEIECADCHGTPDLAPWDLPLGSGEEFQQVLGNTPRGLGQSLPGFMNFGTPYAAEDGYLLTDRGNPFGNVVLQDGKVILHSASGLDFEVPVLKTIKATQGWRSSFAEVAMGSVTQHMDSMECYACHAAWAPQCYGCHITVDYSEGKSDVDWINNANARGLDGLTPDNDLGTNGLVSAGKVSETRSYLRWEEPILGIKGEGRVSPLMPGCQVITTVIDENGQVVAENVVWHTPEGNGDHAAVQPHTMGRNARTCESCHNNPKTLGYGISDGVYLQGYDEPLIIDLESATGEIIPGTVQIQSPAIPEIAHDLSQIVSRDGEQLVSIGSHWPLLEPMPPEMRAKVERTGLCMGCHQEMVNEEVWGVVQTPGFRSNVEHQDVMNNLLLEAAEDGEFMESP
jgi:hypothetical protein